MAITYLTASAAASSVTPPAAHVNNIIAGTHTGGLISSSASTRILLAKIPATATKVQVIAKCVSGETACLLNFGLASGTEGSNTFSISVFGSVADTLPLVSVPVDVSSRQNQAAGETYKYVTASLQTGTYKASSVLNYQITYTF